MPSQLVSPNFIFHPSASLRCTDLRTPQLPRGLRLLILATWRGTKPDFFVRGV